jgi:hypothetical protein
MHDPIPLASIPPGALTVAGIDATMQFAEAEKSEATRAWKQPMRRIIRSIPATARSSSCPRARDLDGRLQGQRAVGLLLADRPSASRHSMARQARRQAESRLEPSEHRQARLRADERRQGSKGQGGSRRHQADAAGSLADRHIALQDKHLGLLALRGGAFPTSLTPEALADLCADHRNADWLRRAGRAFLDRAGASERQDRIEGEVKKGKGKPKAA